VVKQRQSLLDEIAEIDREYNRKAKTNDEAELQALEDKFTKIREKVKRFNADPKNTEARIDLKGLDDLEVKATNELKYRQETERIKTELERQKELFEQYENY